MKNLVKDAIRRGIITGFNEAFIIDQVTRDKLVVEDAKSIEVLKPFLIGEDIHKYSVDFHNRYLVWTYVGIPITQYPAIYKHLQQYQTQLEKRWDKGNYWWELRHCDYYSDFEKPRIIYQEIATYQSFAYLDEELYANAKCFIIPTNDLSLLSLLNSKLIWFWLSHVVSKLQGGAYAMQSVYLVDTPIRRINFVTSDKDRTYYLEKAKLLYNQCIGKDDQDCILGFVNHHLSQEPEASDIVHDLLAFLAEEMLRLNKEKRAAQRAFLDWLVDTLKIQPQPDKDGKVGIDSLKHKAKLLDYPGDYQKGEDALTFAEVKSILLENKKRLLVSLNEALLAKVEQYYQQILDTVLPLKRQLAQTDTLIDRVVYRLYDLTEEEICVVEGQG